MSLRSYHPYQRSAPSGNASTSGSSSTGHRVGGGDNWRLNASHSYLEKLTPSYNTSNPTHNLSTISGCQNVEVNGGTFSINTGSSDEGIMRLSDAASKEAMHDSSARYPPPKCHPLTRKEIVDFFVEWAKTDDPGEWVYWMHSPFGHGKSAIMQTIIDRLIEEGHRHRVAGGFFFGRGKHGRDKIDYLLPSISYQMAINLPGMREIVNRAMLADPALPSKSIDVQLQFLIINPLREWANGPHFHHTPTVFIDGLDECDTIDGQLAVLDLITKALVDHHVPLRLVVASRPEPHIRDHFDQARLGSISQYYEVPNDDDEMTVYAESKFDEIYEKRSRIMKAAGIHKPWPSADQIKELVRRASGQYVFVDTILRFVDAHRFNPADRLKTALSRLADSSVFSEMDAIYRLVLEQCPHEYWDLVMAIIDTIMWNIHMYFIALPCVAEITQYGAPQLHLAVESIAAVVELDDHSKISFHHLSFYEFLTDKSRSGDFFCDSKLAAERWEGCALQAFKRSLAAEKILVNPSSRLAIMDVLLRGVDQIWATSTELQGLLLEGQSKVKWGTEGFAQWYDTAAILSAASEALWITSRTERIKWLAGDLDIPFSAQLHRQCLDIWKNIADKAFAEMDSRLANALIDSGRSICVRDLADEAGMDAAECLRMLKQHQYLVSLTLRETLDEAVLLDHRYVQFDDQGNKIPISTIRRKFYNPIQ